MKVIISGRGAPCKEYESKLVAEGIEILRCGREDWESVVAMSKQGAEVLMICGGGIPGEVIGQLGDSIRAIVSMFVGIDEIDVDVATSRGIMVCNNPNYGTEDVAAMAISMVLALNRKLPFYHKRICQGEWSEKGKFKHFYPYASRRLSSMTLGIIGFGAIGKATAEMAKKLGMRVIAYGPTKPTCLFDECGVEKVNLDTLFSDSDAISIHLPLNKETYHLINAEAIAKMKDQVLLVNTARGGIIDSTALKDALLSGKIAAAALDVFEKEPISLDDTFLTMDNVLITPHSAWHTEESFRDAEYLAVEMVICIAKGGVPYSCVNKKELSL